MAIDIFHDDQRSIRDFADGDGQAAKRHKIGREPQPLHHDERDQRRHDQCHGDDDRTAHMTEKEEEDEDHQHDTLDQGIPHGMDGSRDQLDAIIERHELRAHREDVHLLQLLHLGRDRFHYPTRIPAAEHEDGPGDDFTLAIEHGGAMANRMADADFRHIAHEDRRAARLLHDDGLDIVQCLDQAESADDRPFRMTFEHIAARIRIVLRDGVVDLVQRQVVLSQLGWIDQHLILLHESAQRVHVNDARDSLEQRTQHPILERPLFRQLRCYDGRIGILRARPFHVVLIDFTESCAHRCQHRLHPFRQSFFRRDHSLEHQLAGEVNIDVVLKHDRHLRECEFRERADLRQAGQSGHLKLERIGDEPLDFDRRPPWRVREHLYLDIGDVGIGVNGDRLKRHDTRDGQ